MNRSRAAFVIARRDFTATVLSKTFFFFLLGPLFPLLLGGVFGGIGARVASQTAQPVVAVVMQEQEFMALKKGSGQAGRGNRPGCRRAPCLFRPGAQRGCADSEAPAKQEPAHPGGADRLVRRSEAGRRHRQQEPGRAAAAALAKELAHAGIPVSNHRRGANGSGRRLNGQGPRGDRPARADVPVLPDDPPRRHAAVADDRGEIEQDHRGHRSRGPDRLHVSRQAVRHARRMPSRPRRLGRRGHRRRGFFSATETFRLSRPRRSAGRLSSRSRSSTSR